MTCSRYVIYLSKVDDVACQARDWACQMQAWQGPSLHFALQLLLHARIVSRICLPARAFACTVGRRWRPLLCTWPGNTHVHGSTCKAQCTTSPNHAFTCGMLRQLDPGPITWHVHVHVHVHAFTEYTTVSMAAFAEHA